jgi:pilus assembly protein CpaB
MTGNFKRFGPDRAKKHKARLIAIGGSLIVFALVSVGAILTYGKQAEANSFHKTDRMQSQMTGFGAVQLIAANAPIPAGSKLSSVHLTSIAWPRTEIPVGAIYDINEVNELYARVPLPAGQPIVRSNLSTTPIINKLIDLIPPEHRAITIDVNATDSVEGWAFPGARVDVLVTYRDPEDNVNKSRIAVEDAVVLSFDGRTQGSASDLGSSRITQQSTVTLAVTAPDTLKIRTAQAMGRISLVLRNSNDPRGIGDKTFAADEWERPGRKKDSSNTFVPKGFARYTDDSGNLQEFTLGSNHRWFVSGNESN